MSFQVNSKTAIIITLSLGTITLPAGLQAHQYTGTNNKADNLSLSSDPISDLKSSLPDKKNDKEKNFQKNEADHHSKECLLERQRNNRYREGRAFGAFLRTSEHHTADIHHSKFFYGQ